MKTSDFDKTFDSGKSVEKALDFAKATRPALQAKRVNVDFPAWMVVSLDKEAHRLGVTRQALIKLWLGDRLENRLR